MKNIAKKKPVQPQAKPHEPATAFPSERIPSIRRVMMPRDTNAFGDRKSTRLNSSHQ